MQLVPKSTAVSEMQNNGIMWFKIIKGHCFEHQLKAGMQLPISEHL